jgi:starch synthase
LDDSVDSETGFKFSGADAGALLQSAREALAAWRDSASWQNRMRLGMKKDFSWGASAQRYSELYASL